MPDYLSELLKPDALVAPVQRFADQSEDRSYLAVYEAGQMIEANVDGTFKYDQLDFSRDLAPLTSMDSPSTSAKRLHQSVKTGSVIAVKEHVDLPMRFLEGWRAPGQQMANAGVQINNNLQNLVNRAMRSMNFLAAISLLTKTGAVDLSTIPSSLIAGTQTYPVATLDASQAWSNAATKIRSSEINRLKKAYSQGAGFKAGVALATSAVEGYITGNTEISNFINGGTLAGQILGRSFEERGIGDVVRLGNMDWEFVEDYYATDAAPSTPVDISPDSAHVAILPPRNRWMECFAIAEGVEFVPTGPIATGDVIASPSSLIRAQRGWFSYVTLETKPMGLRLHVGRVFQLVQKMPKAVLVFDSAG